jgi:hypothetical protein
VFGISTDWLLTGEGTLLGNSQIDMALLKAIQLEIAVVRAAIVDTEPTASAVLLLIRAGQLHAVALDD